MSAWKKLWREDVISPSFVCPTEAGFGTSVTLVCDEENLWQMIISSTLSKLTSVEEPLKGCVDPTTSVVLPKQAELI